MKLNFNKIVATVSVIGLTTSIMSSCSNSASEKASEETMTALAEQTAPIETISTDDLSLGDASREKWCKATTFEERAEVFSTMLPEERRMAWVSKLNEVLTLDWTPEEKAHIQSALDVVLKNPDLFDKPIEGSDKANIAAYFAEWRSDSESKFSWPKKVQYAIVGTLERMVNKDGDLEPYTKAEI